MLNSDHIFISLITLCLGFIIAFGLQQIVDLFLRRRRARKQEAAAAQTLHSTHDTSPPAPPPTP